MGFLTRTFFGSIDNDRKTLLNIVIKILVVTASEYYSLRPKGPIQSVLNAIKTKIINCKVTFVSPIFLEQ